jgi:hypothetical protein
MPLKHEFFIWIILDRKSSPLFPTFYHFDTKIGKFIEKSNNLMGNGIGLRSRL